MANVSSSGQGFGVLPNTASQGHLADKLPGTMPRSFYKQDSPVLRAEQEISGGFLLVSHMVQFPKDGKLGLLL